jgi:hypothetical protein
MHAIDDSDYESTIIYKITCKDPLITDKYVGHTIDFVKRRKSHKYACNDDRICIRLYNFIREHGGWDNWTMEIVDFLIVKINTKHVKRNMSTSCR